MGAAGPCGLVAWIESECDMAKLYVAGKGRLVLERSLARGDTLDFGYGGCHARYLAWHGDRVVVLCRESSCAYLRSLDPDGENEQGMSCSWDWAIDRDLAVWVSDDPGLLCTAALPSLDARPPLPFRGTPLAGHIRLELRESGQLNVSSFGPAGNQTIDTLALPTEHQRAGYAPLEGLLDVAEHRLFPSGGASMASRLVIEAVGHPYVRGAIWRKKWQPAPVWIPVYLHRYLISAGRKAEAAELLDILDRIAAPLPDQEPEQGWDPRWNAQEGQIELALHYIRRQARTLASVCRSGVLPQGWWCLLFDPAPKSQVPGSRVDPTGYSATLLRVFEELALTRPARLVEAR